MLVQKKKQPIPDEAKRSISTIVFYLSDYECFKSNRTHNKNIIISNQKQIFEKTIQNNFFSY